MSTKRDLVDAHAYSRRRLVTAFVSGAPGGREVEPARPARAIIGGIALGVLMLAGAALASMFAGRSPADWTDPGIIISKENGNHYVVLAEDQPVQPVVNPVSAQLLMGQVEPKSVKQEDISAKKLGVRIGIYDAPNSIPVPSMMRNSGWTACTTTEAATKIFIGEEMVARPVEGAMVVRTKGKAGQQFLIARSAEPGHGYYRYLLPVVNADALIADLGLDTGERYQVSDAWLDLFPKGPDLSLASFDIADRGKPLDYQVGNGKFEVGDLAQNERTGQVYVLGPEGPLNLDEFSQVVYEVVAKAKGEIPQITGKPGQEIESVADWPSTKPQSIDAPEACGVLNATPGGPATVSLAVDPSEDESASKLRANVLDVAVQPGYGAYVNVGQHGAATAGTPVVIDMDAKRYRLGGPKGETAELLGFGSVKAPTVPDAWTESFDCGPELSQEAARRQPTAKAMKTCG